MPALIRTVVLLLAVLTQASFGQKDAGGAANSGESNAPPAKEEQQAAGSKRDADAQAGPDAGASAAPQDAPTSAPSGVDGATPPEGEGSSTPSREPSARTPRRASRGNSATRDRALDAREADQVQRSSSRAQAAARKAAGLLKETTPDPGALGAAGVARGGAGPSSVAPDKDLGLAWSGPYRAAFSGLGLELKAGPNGAPLLVHADGKPASSAEAALLRERLSSMPEAASRFPDFFRWISAERHERLKLDFLQDGSRERFRDVGLSDSRRDFSWSRSCAGLSGDCNRFRTESSYRKGGFVPPQVLDRIARDGEEGAAKSSSLVSEYTEEEEKEAEAAFATETTEASSPRSWRHVSLSNLLASLGFGSGSTDAAASDSGSGATSFGGSAFTARTAGARASGTRRAFSRGEPGAASGLPGAEERRGGRRLAPYAMGFGALILLAGVIGAARRRRD